MRRGIFTTWTLDGEQGLVTGICARTPAEKLLLVRGSAVGGKVNIGLCFANFLMLGALGFALSVATHNVSYADVIRWSESTSSRPSVDAIVLHFDSRGHQVQDGAAIDAGADSRAGGPARNATGQGAAGSTRTRPREVLFAIETTALRYKKHPALARIGVSSQEWVALLQALVRVESGFDPNAISPKGALGLAQLMPATARGLGVDAGVPTDNLDGGARYLLTQLATFGSVPLALAAYNAGPQAVRDYGGIPPYVETQTYVARVLRERDRVLAGF